MVTTHDILWGVIAPAIWAGVVLFIAWRGWRRGANVRGEWASAIAIGGAYAMAHAGIERGVPDMQKPSADLSDWLFYVAMGVTLLGLIQSAATPRAKGMMRWAMGLLIVGAAASAMAWLMLRPLVPNGVKAEEFWMTVSGWAGVAVAWWVVVGALAERVRGAGVPLVLTIVAAGTAIVVTDYGNQTLGQFAGALMAAAIAASAIGWWTKTMRVGAVGVMVFAVLLVGVMLAGHYLGSPEGIPFRDIALLLGGGEAGWVGELPGMRKWKAWKVMAIRVAAASIPVGIAAVPAAIALVKLARSEATGEM